MKLTMTTETSPSLMLLVYYSTVQLILSILEFRRKNTVNPMYIILMFFFSCFHFICITTGINLLSCSRLFTKRHHWISFLSRTTNIITPFSVVFVVVLLFYCSCRSPLLHFSLVTASMSTSSFFWYVCVFVTPVVVVVLLFFLK